MMCCVLQRSDRVRFTKAILEPESEGSQYVTYFSKLTVMNGSTMDQGIYTCNVTTGASQHETVQKNVILVGKCLFSLLLLFVHLLLLCTRKLLFHELCAFFDSLLVYLSVRSICLSIHELVNNYDLRFLSLPFKIKFFYTIMYLQISRRTAMIVNYDRVQSDQMIFFQIKTF